MQAGILIGSAGRGPGSGIRASAPAVAMMIIATMASDNLADLVVSVEQAASRTSQNGRSPGLGSGLGLPWKNAARMPDASSASMAASVCCGVGLLWHQSTSVVVPQLIWFSAPARVAMPMSSGRKSFSVLVASTSAGSMGLVPRPSMTMSRLNPVEALKGGGR